MQFFLGKNHPRQGCIKGCGETGRGAADHEEVAVTFFHFSLFGIGFAHRSADLYRRTFTAQGQAAAQAEETAEKFVDEHAQPGVMELAF